MKKITLLLNLAMVYGLLFFFTSCDDKQAQRIIKKQEFKKLLYYTLNIYSDSQVKKALKDFERAKAAGYTHILLDDTKFQKLDIMGKFQIMITDANADILHMFLPDQKLFLELKQMVDFYVNQPLDWELAIELEGKNIETTQPGNKKWSNLGWNTWLASENNVPHKVEPIFSAI